MDGKFVRGLTFRMWLLLRMMEEWMPSSNALPPEMLFPTVDDAIWAAENATLKAEMSGKKLMHSWNNLSSTLNVRHFKRGFGILQLYLMVLELPVYKGLTWQRDHVAMGSSFDGHCCWRSVSSSASTPLHSFYYYYYYYFRGRTWKKTTNIFVFVMVVMNFLMTKQNIISLFALGECSIYCD